MINIKNVTEWLPWVSIVILFITQKIASYYDFAQKNDPDIATKMKHIGLIAKWAVADQSRYADKAGAAKFEDAVDKVVKETGVSTTLAKGAVQASYIDLKDKKDSQMPADRPVVVPQASNPIVTENTLKPVEDTSATVEDLDPHR